MTFLGIGIDTESGLFYIENKKLVSLEKNLRALIQRDSISARDLASVAGKLQSLSLALGSNVRIFSRGLFGAISACPDWNSVVSLSDHKAALLDIGFWLKNLRSIRKEELHSSGMIKPTATIQTDASDSGFGGFVSVDGETLEVAGRLPDSVVSGSSSERELYGIFEALKRFRSKLPFGSKVRIRSDSQVAVHGLKVGSRTVECQQWIRKCGVLALENNWLLEPEWVPREENKRADFLSREQPESELVLSHSAFRFVCSKLGMFPMVDRFASSCSAKCDLFCSKWFCSKAMCVDAFSMSWDIGPHWNYCFPPCSLVKQVIRKVVMDKSKALLILPNHPKSIWWGMITKGQLSEFCSATFRLKRGSVGTLDEFGKWCPVSLSFGYVALCLDASGSV
eukprot:TRINITY_DN296_c1_g1_i9.p1 TRINITY_DN296_c1_g1~~TRINITY_DN296_c1_g1_i9.p1  ORF type:complete len:395 (+),score=43.12 TRINITY_DN296_c1_g1_i9:968-2152(+)